MAGARSLPWLWLCAVMAGMSQSIANPATNQLIVDHIPSGRRALQIGVKQSGVQMVQTLIGFGLPPLALLAGWRTALLTGALLAGLGLAATGATIPGTTRRRPRRAKAPPRQRVDASVWWLAAYTCAIGVAVQGVLVYAPLYGFETVGFSAGVAGMATGVLGAAGVVARIVWSRLAERSNQPVRMMRRLAVGAAGSVLLILLSQHLAAWLLWAGLVGFGASAIAVNAVVMLAVIRDAKGGQTGQASGIVGLGLYIGFMLGPLGHGAVVDLTGSYTLGWSLVLGACLSAYAITLAWHRRG
jgi:MFS family permease